MAEAEQVEVAAEVQAPVTAGKGKKAAQSEGNLIMDIAARVEKLTKGKALTEAERLATQIETNYFEMGGVLNVILKNTWFEPFESFEEYVQAKFGFQKRKAHYLISIYSNLVEKQIPWDKVSHLGWTKLKDLAPILTLENVDEWASKAAALTVSELQAVLKGEQGGEGSETTSKTSDDIVKFSFKVKADAGETIQSAISKAKAELATEHDNVAFEGICAGYLGGNSAVVGTTGKSLKDQMLEAGPEMVLEMFGEMFPQIDITVG